VDNKRDFPYLSSPFIGIQTQLRWILDIEAEDTY